MRLRTQTLVIVVGSMLSQGSPFAACCVLEDDGPAEAAVKPVEVVRTNDYTEGVVVDHDGNLYFSHEKIVTKVTPDGKASTWAQTGSPNGHKVLADGTHLICDASRHALLHLAADGTELKPGATESDGEPLRGPNDLTLDPTSGGVVLPGVKGLEILPPKSGQ
jgi:sugar lactone lactonase YvrE